MSHNTRKKLGSIGQFSLEEPIKSGSNSQMIEKEEIAGSPFELLKENGLYYIVWGTYKLTEGTEDWTYAMNELEKEKWLITARMIFAIMHARDKALAKAIHGKEMLEEN